MTDLRRADRFWRNTRERYLLGWPCLMRLWINSRTGRVSLSKKVTASLRVDHKRLMGIFSNKMAAHLSGLGWIGKSCLLITPEVGPRVRWATVLTTAPLSPSGQPLEERCGGCSECVQIYPAQAFTGRAYRDDEHRDLRFDVYKCQAYFDQLDREMEVAVCGMCLYVCPYGRRRAKTEIKV